METSRDDFVIAVRSAFLKKGAAQRFSLLALIFISITLLSLEFFQIKPVNVFRKLTKDLIYRGSFIISIPHKTIINGYGNIKDHFDLYEKNNILQNQISILEKQQKEIEFLRVQNKELKIVIKEDLNRETQNIIAKVLLDKQSPFLKSIILNKGTKFKINKGMPVLFKNNMVGRIVEVNYLSSRALLISDLNSKIPVKIEPSGENAIMTGAEDYFADLEYLPKKSKISIGNTVYTSGTDGIFIEGIPVGKINIKDDKYVVEFLADLNQMNFVTIVNYKNDIK